MSHGLPEDSAERKQYPVTTGVLDYFSAAIAEVAKISYYGNMKHNPGLELHWSRDKSADHADTVGRHLIERGGKYEFKYVDEKGAEQVVLLRHSASLAWRAMALLTEELEAEGAPPSRGSKFLPAAPTLVYCTASKCQGHQLGTGTCGLRYFLRVPEERS